uniref:Uncharacterized protein n=1 Tax=Panagrolaimus sp. PS1159 TaxID=55785 RepID=A0AC35GLF9_9BILA
MSSTPRPNKYDIVNGIENIRIQSQSSHSAPPRTSSSSFSSIMSSTPRPNNNDIVNGIENIRIQPQSSQQHQQSIHRPQFAYPQPQQFFFLN